MQADVKYELEDLRPNLFIQETEDSWEKIAKAIMSLIKLCENGAYDTNPTDLVGLVKSAYRPIVSAMNSERTRLCLVPMDLMGSLAAAMGTEFEQLLSLFLPPLLTNCARTNKVVVNRAKSSILAVIEGSQLASVLTYFLQNMKDKSSSMKIAIAEGTLACLNSCNPPDVEKEPRALEIEGIIRITARDANADVRKLSRKIYESYTLLLPSRVKSFTAPLSPTTKKYLDIKSTTTATTSSETLQKSSSSLRPSSNPRLDVKSKPSASSSTTLKPAHSRTASTVTLSTSTNASQMRTQPTTITRVSRKEPAAAPAPHVPSRPAQPSRVVSDTHKSAPHRPTNLTASQEEKRPVPPLRTQRSVISRTVQGPSTSSGAPHRIQIPTTTKPPTDSGSHPLPSTGPRRVPMPPPPPPAPKKETEGPKRQPAKAEGSSSQRPIVPPAPVKKKSTSSLSSSIKDRVQASRPAINHTRTKSSAAVTDSVTASTSVATTGASVKPLVVSKAKPQWGRSAPVAKPVPGPSQKAPVKPTVPVVKKPSSRIVPAPKPGTTSRTFKKGSKDVAPETIPLPPTPPPTDNQGSDAISEVDAEPQNEVASVEADEGTEENVHADVTETNSPIPPESVDEVDGDEDVVQEVVEAETEGNVEETEQINEEEQNETASSSMTDITAVHTSINNKENIPISEQRIVGKAGEVSEEAENTSSMIFSKDENPQTPQQQGLLSLPSANDAAAAKTPISALLSSIERGFKYDYSPITPLSPADCYLPNINGATPYSHHIHAPHIKGPMQPFNHALHAPGHSGIFGGFGATEKPKEELVRGDIGVVQLSEYNKLYMATSLPGLDDGRQTFIELNDD